MKKLIVVAAVISVVGVSGGVEAAGHNSLSVGYAQTQLSADLAGLKGSKELDIDSYSASAPGFNVKYHWESDAGWGVIASYAYSHKNVKDINLEGVNQTFTVGPSWRFNDYFNIYALVGAGYGYLNLANGGYYNANNWQGTFAYGAGLQVNPVANLVIDASYVYTHYNANYYGVDIPVAAGTWMLGVGYRF